MSVPRSVLLAVMALFLPAAVHAAGKCAEDGPHGAAVLAARAALLSACSCEGSASRSAYVACARTVIAGRVATGALPRTCRGRVQQFASRSTCGRDGFVTCCIRSAAGRWRPAMRRAAAGCVAPRNGAACEAAFPHLLQACDVADGCRAPGCGDGIVDPATEECEPPGTAACDAECRLVPECGNGIVHANAGEECEPPGTGTCDANCQFVHTCGDGVIEPGEECDGQDGCGPSCTLARATCCQFGGSCFGSTVQDDADAYFSTFKPCIQIFFGQGRHGTCDGPPCPDPLPPGWQCADTPCGDRPIDPLPLCCQQAAGGCRDTVATTAGGIGGFACSSFPPPDEGDVDRLMLGTCGGDGRCVPAS